MISSAQTITVFTDDLQIRRVIAGELTGQSHNRRIHSTG